jgi:hypothetical protein
MPLNMQLRPRRHRARPPRPVLHNILAVLLYFDLVQAPLHCLRGPHLHPQRTRHDPAGSPSAERHGRRVPRLRGHMLVRKCRMVLMYRNAYIPAGVPGGAGMTLLQLSLAKYQIGLNEQYVDRKRA